MFGVPFLLSTLATEVVSRFGGRGDSSSRWASSSSSSGGRVGDNSSGRRGLEEVGGSVGDRSAGMPFDFLSVGTFSSADSGGVNRGRFGAGASLAGFEESLSGRLELGEVLFELSLSRSCEARSFTVREVGTCRVSRFSFRVSS